MNNYVFIRVVGKGSYGEVNLVRHKADRKQYVVKRLNLSNSPKRERRSAEQEAQLLSQLRHPNIVTYRESWEGNDSQLYIVMGFCEAGDLYHRLKEQKGELLPERQVVEWFVQIAMALQYLHERNILHRDLKTQNIFLTKNNIIKVGDLGIARVLENQNDMASTLIGTPYYMSPELFSNKPYNHKSDVWALGCCLYEMSTLRHAFNAKDMNSLVYRIVQGKLPQMPSRYDPQLGDLIKRMLSKSPEDRPEVKIILRQPYIKHQIAMFLEATKEKTAKTKKKTVGGNGDLRSISVSPVMQKKPTPSRQMPQSAAAVKKEEASQHRGVQSSRAESPRPQLLCPPANQSSTCLATISNIDVDIQEQQEAEQTNTTPSSSHVTQNVQKERGKSHPSLVSVKPLPRPSSGAGRRVGEVRKCSAGFTDLLPGAPEKPGKTFSLGVVDGKQMPDSDDEPGTLELLKEAEMNNVKPVVSSSNPEGRSQKCSMEDVDQQENLESTEMLLQPFPSALEPEVKPSNQMDQLTPTPSYSAAGPLLPNQHSLKDGRRKHQQEVVASRPLPPRPLMSKPVEVMKQSRKVPQQTADVHVQASQERLLSARERRRLRQSLESHPSDLSSIRQAPCGTTPAETAHVPVSRADSLVSSRHGVIVKRSDDEDEDEECSSSTSSTDRSEGDERERKTESTEMQDLVQMMTQTLSMNGGHDVNKEGFGSVVLPEFKLNRKYRDTLALHGKACSQTDGVSLSEIPKGFPSRPAKIRLAVEKLRTDVLKGLGVKLLDRVLEIMEEEDDGEREVGFALLFTERSEQVQLYPSAGDGNPLLSVVSTFGRQGVMFLILISFHFSAVSAQPHGR
ncbi:serine/threonine-protein kinase Nek4 isoform X2 [Synchiropus splendidus]|uniref:serine/threonine-protein kinase Nek4 isoform X2 n=1 Tax=Synchiropus splendidus TaxID=270530 RepID=UPI00237E71BA|nr:serine/threonine-protein kinase Nek4 isoform X2 [Synchiropus splendidus]